jgi:hypothetical protein
MAQELDFTDPEHMAGSTMAAFCAGAIVLLRSCNE